MIISLKTRPGPPCAVPPEAHVYVKGDRMTALGSRLAPKTSPKAPRTMTRKRWMIIWLAFIGLSINYLDRSSLSVALPFMGTVSYTHLTLPTILLV